MGAKYFRGGKKMFRHKIMSKRSKFSFRCKTMTKNWTNQGGSCPICHPPWVPMTNRLGYCNKLNIDDLVEDSFEKMKRRAERRKEWREWVPGTCLRAEHLWWWWWWITLPYPRSLITDLIPQTQTSKYRPNYLAHWANINWTKCSKHRPNDQACLSWC